MRLPTQDDDYNERIFAPKSSNSELLASLLGPPDFFKFGEDTGFGSQNSSPSRDGFQSSSSGNLYKVNLLSGAILMRHFNLTCQITWNLLLTNARRIVTLRGIVSLKSAFCNVQSDVNWLVPYLCYKYPQQRHCGSQDAHWFYYGCRLSCAVHGVKQAHAAMVGSANSLMA